MEVLNKDNVNFQNIKPLVLKSVLTCPKCGFHKEEIMPEDACCFFYECTNCHNVLKPKESDCCVFCSYGSVKCPPKQQKKDCC